MKSVNPKTLAVNIFSSKFFKEEYYRAKGEMQRGCLIVML